MLAVRFRRSRARHQIRPIDIHPVCWSGRRGVTALDSPVGSVERISRPWGARGVRSADARFCNLITASIRRQRKGDSPQRKDGPARLRGGSTISSRTQERFFLWPERSYVRKGAESLVHGQIETIGAKSGSWRSISTTVSWVLDIYTEVEAASGATSTRGPPLTPSQASRLASILPSPLKLKADDPGPMGATHGRTDVRFGPVCQGRMAAVSSVADFVVRKSRWWRSYAESRREVGMPHASNHHFLLPRRGEGKIASDHGGQVFYAYSGVRGLARWWASIESATLTHARDVFHNFGGGRSRAFLRQDLEAVCPANARRTTTRGVAALDEA